MIEVYRFYTTTEEWRYTNAEEDLVYLSKTYEAIPIDRDEISFEFNKTEAKITMPYDYEPASLFRALNPSTPLWVLITDYENSTNLFIGKVVSCLFEGAKGKATFSITSIQAIFKSGIPNRTFSYSCSNNLFDSRCTVVDTAFKISIPLLEAVRSGGTLQHADIGTKPDGYFTWGNIVAGGESSFIVGHVGDTLTLLTQIQTGEAVPAIIFAGCNKELTSCDTKFSNSPNYGGFRHLPKTNLFLDGW
jgi:hypothetical protein